MASSDDPLRRLHRDLGLKVLGARWAKLEIFIGLAAASAGAFGGMRLAAWESRAGKDADWSGWVGLGALVVLGGYLALAGQRSHLYQSNNRLTGYLAELIRKPQPPGNHS